MEDIVKTLLAEQIKERKITVRAIHKEIDRLCCANKDYDWFSMSTLERRLQRPTEMSEAEGLLIRDALKNIVTESAWTHMRRNITEKMRYTYAGLINEAVNNGFALSSTVKEYTNKDDDLDFIKKMSWIYEEVPDCCRLFWNKHLNTYTHLPNISKACLLCSSYIGKNIHLNKEYNKKIIEFINIFPLYEGASVISNASDDIIKELGNILIASVDTIKEKPRFIHDCAHGNIIIPDDYKIKRGQPDHDQEMFLNTVLMYKNNIVDYKVRPEDMIKELCFILCLDKFEWLLAYVTTIFSQYINPIKEQITPKEYHTRGCSGFSFINEELDYLNELLSYIII